jgi:hypothetical protein
MRVSSALSLFVSALALAACGGTAEETLNVAGTSNAVCGLTCPTVNIPPTVDRTGTASNTGNNESIAEDTGDVSIVLEKSIIKNLDVAKPAYSTLTENAKKTKAQIAIDPNIKNQKSWPKPVEMTLYASDNSAFGGQGSYREYRALTRNEQGNSSDEELQVWRWSKSYATQYRDATQGGEAVHQAYSFGGKKTKAIPTAGTAKYAGRFGSTAKTWSWVQPDGADLSIENIWQVQGKSDTDVDFATGNVRSTLTPEKWKGWMSRNGKKGWLTVDLNGPDYTEYPKAAVLGDNTDNRFSFMEDKIYLRGKLKKDPKNGNTIQGTAKMGSQWVSGGNGSPFHGALFGNNADEVTGVFNVEAVDPKPYGPDFPINDDRRGFLNHSGVFHGKKQ